MLKLKKLHLSGIGRFVEEQIVDFESLGNLIQVDGLNNNTGGSSGAGKSTLFNALDFLLGINDLPNTVLQSRLTKDAILVKGEFLLDGKPLVISRGKKLSIEYDGNVVTGSSKISEEYLDKILSVPRHLFRPMVHKRQKEGGFFLKFTPKETNDFLTDCLDLSAVKAKLDKVELNIKTLDSKKNSLIVSLESCKSAIRATDSAISSLGQPPTQEVEPSTVEGLKRATEASGALLADTQIRHRIELETINNSKPTLTQRYYDLSLKSRYEADLDKNSKVFKDLQAAEQSKFDSINAQVNLLTLEKTKLLNVISHADNAKVEGSKLSNELRILKANICPTCNQEWGLEGSIKDAEARITNRLHELRTLILNGSKASKDIEQIDTQVKSLKESLETYVPPNEFVSLIDKDIELKSLIAIELTKEKEFNSEQFRVNKEKLDVFSIKQKELSQKQSQEIESIYKAYDSDRRAFENALYKLKSFQESKKRYDQSLTVLTKQMDSYQVNLEEITTSLESTNKKLVLSEELKKGIKSYLSCSFEDILKEIGEISTSLIRGIPNMANATIEFEGIKETKDGKIKEEVNALIHNDGEQAVPIKSLSGGERSAVDLAVDLAVMDLIECRTNKGIDLLILDEPFNGLDSTCIEYTLEMLKNSNINKRLVIVDHNQETKQMIESKVTVVRDGNESKIVQA